MSNAYDKNIKNDANFNLLLLLVVLISILVCVHLYVHLYVKITQHIYIKRCNEQFNNISHNIPHKYSLAIMAIFKSENEYMEEWLDHHIAQGFEHIYLYCNDPNIYLYKYLTKSKYTPYIKLINWVDKKNIGSNTIQRQAYTDCVKKFSYQTQFLLMLDLDEFLIPIEPYPTVSEYINSLKSKWGQIQAFKIQRYDFGSNGHKTKPMGSVMKNYIWHEKICSSYKTLANTDYINKNKNFYGVHDYNYVSNKIGKIFNNYFTYNETGFPNSCKYNSINEIPLVINHYYTKSYEEYMNRCKIWKNGGINPIGYRNDCEKTFKSRDVNQIKGYDYLKKI